MGTSASSGGPGGGVPFVPPWVPPVDPGAPATEEPAGDGDQPDEEREVAPRAEPPRPPPEPPALAPARRFGGTRTALGEFGRSGSDDAMRRGLGQYTHRGMGGARRAAQRLAGTSLAAGGLRRVLAASSAGQPTEPTTGLTFATLAGRSSSEVAAGIIGAVCPADGTQDAEASRSSMAMAISDLLESDDSADLLKLSEPQIDFVIERFVAYDISHRIELDVGAAIQSRAPDARTAVRRLEELREFVVQKVAAAFRSERESGTSLTTQNARQVSNGVIESVFEVFEDYIK